MTHLGLFFIKYVFWKKKIKGYLTDVINIFIKPNEVNYFNNGNNDTGMCTNEAECIYKYVKRVWTYGDACMLYIIAISSQHPNIITITYLSYLFWIALKMICWLIDYCADRKKYIECLSQNSKFAFPKMS